MKRFIKTGCLGVLILAMLLIGCRGLKNGISEDSTGSKYSDFITVDVFASESNYEGMQTGWFGKLVKDKFNMELNIIAPNTVGDGDVLFQTRMASGNVGDLIICNTGNGTLAQMVQAGLVQDMTDLLLGAESITRYSDAVKSMKKAAARDGIYGIPIEVSSNSPETPSVGLEPNYAPYIRWDVYEQIGCPEITNMDDLLNVLKEMQDANPVSDSGEKVYAFSLFKDWDRNMMTFARNMACMYGYDEFGLTLLAADGSGLQRPDAEDSVYRKGLEFINKANQMGLVDPDSATQNYDTMYQKIKDGAVLFSFWSWVGQQAYNTPNHTSMGKGFKLLPVKDMQIVINGCRPYGNSEKGIMIGSQAEDPQRLADFIDWLYSPEGIMASQASGTSDTCGPEGLTWEMKDGEPVLTEFGNLALGGLDIKLPEEWGGGTWQEGICAFNVTFVSSVDINPDTNQPYMYTLWDSTKKDNRAKLDENWSSKTGAQSAIEYLEDHEMLVVAPGDSYTAPEEDYQITTIRNQCGKSLISDSWQMAFADSDDQFDAMYSQMKENLEVLKFEKVLEHDKKSASDKIKAREEAVQAYDGGQ